MAILSPVTNKVLGKCQAILGLRGGLLLVTGVISVLGLRILRRIKQTTIDLHARFGGPTQFNSIWGFLPRTLEQCLYAFEIFADTYGGIYYIRAFGQDMVVVSSQDSIRQVLKERPNAYTRSFNKDKVLPISGMFTTEGDEWKRNRRLGAPAFNDSNSAAMVHAMSKVTAKLVRCLQHLASEPDGRIVWSPTQLLHLCTLDVLCTATLGKDFNFLNPEKIQLSQHFEDVQGAIMDSLAGAGYAVQWAALPWATRDRFPWNLNPMIRKLHTGVRRLRSTCEEIIGMRRAEKIRGESKERDDLLDKLMHLEKDDLQGNLITFLIAGSETTSTTVAWCLYYLCLYPHIQTKARVEVDKLGRDPAVDADLELLTFTQGCILETLRLKPATGFLPQACIRNTTLAGQDILPGAVVVTLLHKAMVAESCGGTTFWPERWLSSNGCGIDKDRARDHLAFGGGPRQCPGQVMALKEATVLLAMILRHFDNIEHSHDISLVRAIQTFTYTPENLELQMIPRSPPVAD